MLMQSIWKENVKVGDRVRLAFVLIAYIAAAVVSVAPRAIAINKLDATDIPSPNVVIAILVKSFPVRESLSRKSRLLGKKAPNLHLAKWINEEQETVKWPAQKLTLLWFWDLHCGVCRLKIREMCEWAARVEERGGRFISIHAHTGDDELVAMRKLLEGNDYRFNVAIDQYCDKVLYGFSKTFHAFGVGATPTCVTVSADGRILSYKRPQPDYWDELVKGDSAKFKPDPIEEIRPLTLMPSPWVIESVPPNFSVNQRFLLYRPDTPKLSIRMLKSSDPNVVMTYNKYSDQGQTVFSLLGQTTVPIWGRALKGTIDIEVEYGSQSDTLEIPFTIASKPLLAYNPGVYLGIVEKGKEIVKRIIFRTYVPRESLRIKVIHVPSGVTVQLPESLGIGCGKIPIELCFHSFETGTQRGIVKLKALYNQQERSEQLVELKYTAIVRD